ncbi:hypothetical protein, partial [Campylobacter sp. MIT 97-5078]
LYVYRIRSNSIITSQKEHHFPQKMPLNLEILRPCFKDYQSLRAYFRAYCLVRIAEVVYDFMQANKNKQKFFKKVIKKYIYDYIFYHSKTNTAFTQEIHKFLNKIGIKNVNFYRQKLLIRMYWRNPKKIIALFFKQK